MKYLITGAAGFVGSHLSLDLLKRGHSVIALDLGFPEEVKNLYSSHGEIQLVTGSVLDTSLLSKLVGISEYVIHLAAIASPEYYVREPKRTIDLNLNASIAIIELLRFTGKPLFYTSTSEVFGKNPNVPWSETEDRVLGPTTINRWCYSTSKAMIEHYLSACHQEGSINYDGVRIFNCYGPRLRGRVVDSFIDLAIARKPLVIHGNGQQTRCFTYVDDLISAISLLVTQTKSSNQFYNIGSSVETSINELARTVCSVAGLDPETHIEYITHQLALGSSYEDIPRRVPNCEKAYKTFGWTPQVTLAEGIQRMYEYSVKLGDSSACNTSIFSEVDE